MMRLISLFFIVGLLADIGVSAPNSFKEDIIEKLENLNYRLNTDVLPSDYIIELTPYFDQNIFDGSVSITLKATKPDVKTITLHMQDLEILQTKLSIKSTFSTPFPWMSSGIQIINQFYEENTTKLTLELSESLNVNKIYDLSFSYIGKLRTDMHGFYRSSYKENGETKWLASTQMQPVYARLVFPCFDEPRFKATFKIIMNRPTHFNPTISNAPLETSFFSPSTNTICDIFHPTPKMSTYLVAFIVSDFECRENEEKTFSVCSRPNAIKQTEYSFDVGQKLLAKYDEKFNYKYNTHLNKMTMVAIPDFDAGAMENWGLLTYREMALLHDQNVSNTFAQQRVAAIVAHEQAHMWFGDLVTCDWWSNTWLNEGFARFFEYFGTDMVEDSWGMEQQFVVNQLQSAFVNDALDTTKALFHEVNTPDEIQDRFAYVSYNKGGSVIRMFEHAFGRDTFTKALRNYLKKNELQSSLPEKLFAAFQDVVLDNANVADFMNTWVINAGYPVVNVVVSSDRKTITLTQKRFLRNYPDHEDKTLWTIPISYATNNHNTDFENTKPMTYLSSEQMTIEHGPTEDLIEWIVLNVQQTGFYRVNYDNVTWAAIDKQLYDSHHKIHVHNRAQIVDDALNLARAHQLSYAQALHTIEYLQNETDYIPWLAAFNNFEFILSRFEIEEASIFKNFILRLLKKVYSHLEFYPSDSDTHLDIYNRNLVLTYACKYGHKQCITYARTEFHKLLKGDYKIPVNLVPVVYCSAVAEGSHQEWDYLWEKFTSENLADEQRQILIALGCTKQPDVLSKYFEKILSDYIRLQDKHLAFIYTLMQEQNINLVLDFIVNNFENINKAFESEKEVPVMLSQIAARSTTNEQINKIEHFVAEHKLNDKNLEIALKNAKSNLKWAKEHIPIIKNYLEKTSSNNDTTNSDTTSSATTNTVSCILFALVLVSFFNY